jgi:hypothetical protein
LGPKPIPENFVFEEFECYHHLEKTFDAIKKYPLEKEIIPFVELFFAMKKKYPDKLGNNELLVIEIVYTSEKYYYYYIREEESHGHFCSMEEWIGNGIGKKWPTWESWAETLGGKWPSKIRKAINEIYEQ